MNTWEHVGFWFEYTVSLRGQWLLEETRGRWRWVGESWRARDQEQNELGDKDSSGRQKLSWEWRLGECRGKIWSRSPFSPYRGVKQLKPWGTAEGELALTLGPHPGPWQGSFLSPDTSWAPVQHLVNLLIRRSGSMGPQDHSIQQASQPQGFLG